MRLNRLLRLASAVLLVTSLSGCASFRGGPDRLGNPEVPNCQQGAISQNARSVRAEDECLTMSWRGTDGTLLKQQRNHVVTLRLYLIDQKYNDFERKLLTESRSAAFDMTLIQLGLGSAATLLDQGKATRAISGINTVITGAKESFNKDVMLDRTIAILATQMRASRAAVRTTILDRLKLSYTDWPIGLAMSDLEDYEQSGSLNSALTAVAESAATAKLVNEDRARLAVKDVTVDYDASPAATVLQDYQDAGGDNVLATTREANIRAAMDAEGVPITTRVYEFTYAPDPRKNAVILRLMKQEQSNTAVFAALAKGLIPAN